MAKAPTKKRVAELLASAVATTQGGPPLFATKEEMATLVKHDTLGQLVEYNEAMKDPANSNKVAFRATAAGVQAHTSGAFGGAVQGSTASAGAAPGWAAQSAPPPAGAAPAPVGTNAPVGSFKFDSGITVPAARRGGRGQNVYGFEQMEVGHSFFIPVTNDNPNPSKRVASTVSSASKRLAPKSFIVRSVDETANGRTKGARVWRTA